MDLKHPELCLQDSFIGGEWVTSKSKQRFRIISTSTLLRETDNFGNKQQIRQREKSSQHVHRTTPWSQLIEEHREDLANLLTLETGKPLYEALAEIDYSKSFLWWFAGEAERIQGITNVSSTPGRRIFTIKQPAGVSVALVPWNFPVAMAVRKAATALAAGCTMIVKPSSETPLSTLAVAKLAQDAGFEAGVLNVLTTDLANTPAVSEALCKHPLVKKVTFTGSTRVGEIIARHCAGGIKKLTLGLGGNCPFIVFDDANLDHAVDALMALKWRNAGQACISSNRVYIQRGVYDRFVHEFVGRTKALRVGRGMDPATKIGPLTVPQGISKARLFVEDARARGAHIACGGTDLPELGPFFFQPTVLTHVTEEMLVFKDECFGPICPIAPFDCEEEVVQLANNTSMGLASYFFTKDVDRAWRLLENLESGMIGMNTGSISAAESPFGGIKESGYGKESGPEVAINEYLVSKTSTLTIDGHF
ncbi:hypothetical protein LTS17_001140 [Exophiala oligosperma]